LNVGRFLQVVWKDTIGPNHDIRQVLKITNLGYLLLHACLSDCNNLDSTHRNAIKFNIFVFMEYMWKKILFKSVKFVRNFIKYLQAFIIISRQFFLNIEYFQIKLFYKSRSKFCVIFLRIKMPYLIYCKRYAERDKANNNNKAK
jgi:hypothetical protein